MTGTDTPLPISNDLIDIYEQLIVIRARVLDPRVARVLTETLDRLCASIGHAVVSKL